MNRNPTYDLIGSIAIVKFDKFDSESDKKKWAVDFLKTNNHTKTILEKSDKIKGRLRIAKTRFIAGEDTREADYLENGCRFKFNVDETYFSPRLSNERKLLAEEITKKSTKNKNKILVMFAGVGPFPITIGKFMKKAGKPGIIISNELNRKACKYSEENIKLNKLENYLKVVQGDAKKLPEKLQGKWDFIMMARPNLKDTFLHAALKLSKKGTIIYYHGFGTKEKVLEEIKKDSGNKISRISIRKAGEIGPREFRWLARFKVL